MERPGGLINRHGATHVIVAVQFVDFLKGYEEHRKRCRSLLQCITCALSRLHSNIVKDGFADPTSLVLRWSGISCRMTSSERKDPYVVLCVLIDLVKAEYVYSKSECSAEDIHSFPTSRIFEIPSRIEVHCASCGTYPKMMYSSALELEEVHDLQMCIDSAIDKKDVICTLCETKVPARTLYISPPECVIIRVNQTSPQFSLPLEISVQGDKFAFRSLIVEKEGTIKFLSRSIDGSFIQFLDTKISPVSFLTFSSAGHLQHCRLILLFESTEISKPQEKNHRTALKITGRNVQVMAVGGEEYVLTLAKETAIFLGNYTVNASVPDVSGLHVSSADEDGALLQLSDIEGRSSVKIPDGKNVANAQTRMPTIDRGVQTIPYFSYETCKLRKDFKFFTGLSPEDFQALYNVIGGHATISKLKFKYASTPKKLRTTKHTSEDKLLIFLLRLRRGLPLEELAVMFDCSVSWAGEICYAMTRLIYLTLKEMEDEMFPTAAEQRKTKPQQMKPFKNLRILLDGVSFYIQTPSNFEQQGNTYSSYKSHNVVIFSVGISCNGATIFCSEGMEGSASDKEVILKSGLLKRLSPGDEVMTDRGYELTAEFQAIGCQLIKPPMLGGRQNFTAEEEITTKAIASSRIYTEHAMADIKDNRLLQGVIPLTMLPVISDLVYIAAYLRNFNQCRIVSKKFVPRNFVQEDAVSNPDDPSQHT